MFEKLSCHGVISAALSAPPGPEVIAALDAVELGAVDDGAKVDLLVAWERVAAWVAARAQPVLVAVAEAAVKAAAAFGGDDPNDPGGEGRAEIGAALRLSMQTAYSRLQVAEALTGRHAPVQRALILGDICFLQAKAICEATDHLDDDKAARVAARVLPRARKQSLAELRRALRRAVLAVDPQSAADRAAKAHTERKLDWWPLEDGMAELRLVTSAADVKAVYDTIDGWAHADARGETGNPTDERIGIDARRADTLVDLILNGTRTGSGTGSRPKVSAQLTIDLPTLLGLRDNPAELAGYGPLPAPLARTLAADANWRRLIHDPHTGALLDLGHTAYRPSAALTRYIHARDPVCQFPHCNRPARRCHLDHTHPYQPDNPAGGRTDRSNLGPLCEHHHVLKHRAGWVLQRDPTTAQATWTSPLGKHYEVAHHDHRSTAVRDDHEPDVEGSASIDIRIMPNGTPPPVAATKAAEVATEPPF